MKQVLEGSQAVAEAVKLARVDVISAYPITPQTHIVERLSDFGAEGKISAKYLRVESEHSALAALIGAATGGARTFTSTSSQGLALMHELLHWASGARLPIVMAEVNRALAPGWNIWADQTDSLAQRDTGWIQLYCENSQEVLDSTLIAYNLAETVNLPAMIILDAFYLSHTYEPVDVPEQDLVDRFLPSLKPKFQIDQDDPQAFSSLVTPNAYMEMRYNIAQAMDETISQLDSIEGKFHDIFGRRYGAIESVQCEDADIVMVTSGTITSTCRQVIRDLRAQGEKVGLCKIKMFRPFPIDAIRSTLQNANKIAVIDRNFSFGATGIFAQEIRAALCNLPRRPLVFGYVAGLGGRDVTTGIIESIYRCTKDTDVPLSESIWIGLQEVSDGRARS
ncbi:MAG: pyruvate ferredoxin oxidoreductase [Deltaproteobacteria bacterium]|nr:pyruvate ferredoxin oxidoreductase [Deltaproteobacteria bacterium]